MLPNVLPAVGEGEDALAVHGAPRPPALVPAAVAPDVHAVAVVGVLGELALVVARRLRVLDGAFGEVEDPFARLDAPLELTHKRGTVLVGQVALPVSHAISPLALVDRAVRVPANTLAFGVVSGPGAHVHVAVRVVAGAVAVRVAGAELPPVLLAARQNAAALPVRLFPDPLANVNRAVWQLGLAARLAERPLQPRVLLRLPADYELARGQGLLAAGAGGLCTH
mmetsp:Transcript_8849/g.20958  ORF Transcript_8849/g.20958 Transcript_8849/m.20958 type:complete len:224 (+) Transcript_8849:297-968(+)